MRAVVGFYQREASAQTVMPTQHQTAPPAEVRSPYLGAP